VDLDWRPRDWDEGSQEFIPRPRRCPGLCGWPGGRGGGDGRTARGSCPRREAQKVPRRKGFRLLPDLEMPVDETLDTPSVNPPKGQTKGRWMEKNLAGNPRRGASMSLPTLLPLPQNLATGPPTLSILSLVQALASDVEGFLDYLLDGDNRLVMTGISNQTRTEARRQYIRHAGDKSLAPQATHPLFPSPASSLSSSLSSSLFLPPSLLPYSSLPLLSPPLSWPRQQSE
jgi:hypothetical protein